MRGLFALVSAVTFAATAPASAAPFEFEEDFTLPIVYLNLVVDAGSAQDPAGKAGLANLAGDMLLRGTELRRKNEFFEALDLLGAQIDVETKNEGIVIKASVLSENLMAFLELLGETIARPSLLEAELAKLKREVEGEILEQMGDDKKLVQNHYARFLYGTHPYGNPVLGTRKEVAKVSRGDVVAFYAAHFGPATLAVFGSGAVKGKVIEDWFEGVKRTLAARNPQARPIPEISRPEIPAGRRALIVDKPNATQAQVLLGGAGMRPETSGFYAVQLANHSFGGPTFQARMMQEIRVKRGWTYGAYSTFRFGRETKHFALYYFPKTEDTVPAISLSLKMLEDLLANGVRNEEFAFARESLINNAPFNYDTAKKRLENATAEYLMNFPRGYYRDYSDNIGKVKYEDLLPALRGVFKPANLALTVVGDASKLRGLVSKLPGFSTPVVKSYLED